MVSIRQSHTQKKGQDGTDFDAAAWLEVLQLDSSHAQDNAQKNAQEHRQQLLAVLGWCQSHAADLPELVKKGCEMVEILVELRMDPDSLTTALIFPLFIEKCVTNEAIEKQFGKDIMLLLTGVEKMDAISTIEGGTSHKTSEIHVDNIRRMLMAMVEDVRSIVIKLAERICNLRDVKNGSEEDRVLMAKETASVFAPLANRLGIGQLKWEMEDLSFRYLHPDVYMSIARLLDDKRSEREQYMVDFVDSALSKLAAQEITAEVDGRPKHIYSIWKKMDNKNYHFDQLYDIRAVRVITQSMEDCYGALGVIHANWEHLASEFSDYIATPKRNGYQSIHTVILGPDGKTIEVQIRTEQMHQDAELGVAAHWIYKTGALPSRSSGYDEKMDWLRKLLQWQEEVADSVDLTEELKHQVIEDRVYVFTPKGDIFDLPVGSTPLDFAYYIHSMVGHRCIGAKVFGRIVPFTYQLSTGDKVEILTAKQPNPSRDWLNPNSGFVKSPRARAKVQHWFKVIDKDKHGQSGKDQLESELAKVNLQLKDAEPAISRFNVHSMDDLLAAIGSGDVRINQVVNYLLGLLKPEPEPQIDPRLKQKARSAHTGQVVIQGVGNLLSHMAKCCQPVTGDVIYGYITKGRGIAIHRQDCEQFKRLFADTPARVIEAEWEESYSGGYSLGIRVVGLNNGLLLKDITSVLANAKITVLGIKVTEDNKRQVTVLDMNIEIFNMDDLTNVLGKLSNMEIVLEAKRMSN
ncbi:MAG: GTP pyrophosphokinase [Alteromonadaceae bacterium]|jgi:GTP pyrophosphokinase